MSESTETTTTAVAPVGSQKMSRNITTKFFAGKTAIRAIVRKGPGVTMLGQIVGNVYAAKDKEALDNEGKIMKSVELIGDFEAVCYATGQVLSAPSAYLPNYFAQHTKAVVDASGKPALFAVEIGIEVLPDDQIRGAIDYTWVVGTLIEKPANDPLNEVKRMLANTGKLRLPPPASGAAAIADQSASAEPLNDAPAQEEGTGTGKRGRKNAA